MSSPNKDRADIPALIEHLSQAAEGLEKDDLSTLAKMHGWCEALAEANSPNANEALSSVSQMLEELILGEAEDPVQAIASVLDGISTLRESASSSTSGTAPSEEQAEESDAEVAAKLANIFDDEPPTAEPSPPSGESDAVSLEVADAAPPQDVVAEAPVVANAPPPYEQQPLTIAEKEIEFVKGFVEEALEHLEAIETAVLDVEKAPDDSVKIDDLFRPFHTIKGMAGFLNLRDVNCLTHEVETLLDQGRKGQRSITPDLIDIILEVVDILKVQINSIAEYLVDTQGETVSQPPVAEMINRLRALSANIGGAPGSSASAKKPAETAPADEPQTVAFVPEVPVSAAAEPSTQPAVEPSPVAKPAAKASPAPEPGPASDSRPAATGGRSSVGDQSVRIETAKLDALVDMVGELVIAQTLVGANPKITDDPKLSKDTAQVAKIVRDVQEVAMAMRMIPIGSTFQRMARLIRDVSRKAGKNVELIISGEDTELDKNVIQQIGDPLVHMVRNAVDHGVELPEDRLAAGKPEVGHIHLGAFHQGGNIVIQIQDDGQGLDRDKLIAKGIEKGIVQPDEELTDEQAYALIFAPGFSTAAQVTDISGRGVGMDVVRRNIEQLRGRTEITSEKGHGSTFSICLPLTLAIIDGMVVQVGSERFIFPTITIEQALRPLPEHITTVQQKGEMLMVRGQLIPLIQLGQLFGLTGRIDPCEAMVVIAHCDGRQVGVIVEELVGQQQVVIKTLGERFEGLRGISGAAILGDGRVGLILETSGIAVAYNAWRPPAIEFQTDPTQVPTSEVNDKQDQETSAEPSAEFGDEITSEGVEYEPLAMAAIV